MENKLSSGSNLLWESSRMMLPEHKALLRQHEESRGKKTKPDYDEQLLAQMTYQLEIAFHQNKVVAVTYYEQEAHHDLVGKVTTINHEKQLIQFLTDSEKKEVYLVDLISIELN